MAYYNPISSPCQMVCKLNKDNRCIGCGRSREQIAKWVSYTEEERKAIMATLKV